MISTGGEAGSHFDEDWYTNQAFGIALQKSEGWDSSEEKTVFFDQITFQTEKNTSNLFLIKTKIPSWTGGGGGGK